jgi:succinyl-CoA:acetate CoA-transferase
VVAPDSRVGFPFIPVPPERIAAIVISSKSDSSANVEAPDAETRAIAGHLVGFLENEVAHSRMPRHLQPLQAGIGTIANAVLHGFIDAPFHDLTMYSEVLQDSTFDLMDAGKMVFASGSSITLSAPRFREVMARFDDYKPKLLLRPQEISNHPEVVRRLGLIAINTALEFDIYGNVNSTHVMGTQMMNGIGGSGDFARNASLSVFVTKSTAKAGRISSVVPMVAHVDHTEHDVDILVTEHGLADLRGLAPRERARVIIANCAGPDWRDALADYHDRALVRGGHTPHLLEEALSWHDRLRRTGTMAPE